MRYKERQKERVKSHEKRLRERREAPIVIPIQEAMLVLLKSGDKNAETKKITQQLKEGDTSAFPKEAIVEKKGVTYLDVSLLRDWRVSTLTEFRKNAGALQLLLDADDIQTLAGKRSHRIELFRQYREGVQQRYLETTRESLISAIDRDDELVNEKTRHGFESEDVKAAFQSIEQYAQNIVDTLFSAAQLERFRPRVYVTRSRDVNAFVLTPSVGEARREYLEAPIPKGEQRELPIFINYGMMRHFQEEDFLAGVLAHEFSHLLQPRYLHKTDTAERQRLEYDADLAGMDMANAAGYNPRGLIESFRRLEKERRPDVLRLIFGGDHPETEKRIIELEKQFHRSDLEYANAQKSFRTRPPDIDRAMTAIEESGAGTPPYPARKMPVPEDPEDKTIEKNLEDPDLDERMFLRNGMTKEARIAGQQRILEAFLLNELAEGSLGRRDVLLRTLSSFTKALDRVSHLLEDEKKRYVFSLAGIEARADSAYRVVRPAASEDILARKKITRHLTPGETEEQHVLSDAAKQSYEELRRQFEADFDIEKHTRRDATLEDWIDVSNEDVQPFWDFVEKEQQKSAAAEKFSPELAAKVTSEPMTRPERLAFLRSMLRACMSYRYTIVSIKENIVEHVEWEEAREKATLDVSAIPLAGRAHRRREPMAEEKREVKREEKMTKKDLFTLDGTSIPVEYHLWSDPIAAHPPLLQEMSAIIEEKTVKAYGEILARDGAPDVSPETTHYILRRVLGVGDDASMQFLHPLCEGVEQSSITFFDTVVRTLEQKSFRNLLGRRLDVDGAGADRLLRNQLLTLVGFGLLPQSEKEQRIKEEYLKRLEEDQALGAFPGEFVVCRTADAGGVPLDPAYMREASNRYAQKEETVQKLNIGDPALAALNLKMWTKYGDMARQFLETGKLEGEETAPVPLRFPRMKEEDRTAAAKLFSQEFAALRRRPKFRQKEYKAAEQAFIDFLQRFVAVASSYRRVLYESEAGSARHALLQAELERKYFAVADESGEKRAKWELLNPLVQEAADQLEARLSGMKRGVGAKARDSAKERAEREDFLWKLLAAAESEKERLLHEFAYAQLDPSLKPGDIYNRVLSYRKWGEEEFVWHANRPKNRYPSQMGVETMPTEDVFAYLREASAENPLCARVADALQQVFDFIETKREAARSAEELKEHQKRFKIEREVQNLERCANTLQSVAMGNLYQFERCGSLPINMLNHFWRTAAEAYTGEWKGLEQFKRLDEQLSHWEWHFDNPLVAGTVRETVEEGGIVVPLLAYIQKFSGDLGKVYKVDRRYVTAEVGDFSWPLFLQDVWDEKDIAFKEKSKEKTEEFGRAVRLLREELERIVADTGNMDVILSMQSGFFKEFLLDKKLDRMGVASLDELEVWMPHFSSFAHEASQRNQMPLLIEQRRAGEIRKKKEELVDRAFDGAGITREEREEYLDIDMDDSYALEKKWISVGVWTHKIEDENLGTFMKKVQSALERYKALVTELEAQARLRAVPVESDVAVFSDQVIENEKSRLEIGPVYRLRRITQPLMDWHGHALRLALSGEMPREEVRARVEKNLPERHPLKDVFVLNQLSVQLWQTLQTYVGDQALQDLGVRLEEKQIDLKDALKQFPAQYEISFLKSYTKFELVGLAAAARQLPREAIEQVLEILERAYRDEMSPEQAPFVRRFLMEIESQTVWPALKKRRETDEAVLQEYLDRLFALYPTPSLERDALLDTIGFDLAYTPEQIRAVWQERYEDKVRWPEEGEEKRVTQQFEAFERLRRFTGFLSAAERAEEFLWLLGRPGFGSAVTLDKTGISLENRRAAFWGLSPNERRALLYEFLLGKEGIFEKEISSTFVKRPEVKHPWERWYSADDLVKFVSQQMFDQIFGDQRLDESLSPDHETNVMGRSVLRTTFTNLFIAQKEPARRAELMANIVEGIGKARYENRTLETGEIIRLLLEQAGVMGIKIGQVLSEVPGLLPEKIRHDLEGLKDSVTPFSKRAILSYLEATGWIRGEASAVQEIGDVVGSASVKQVQHIRTTTGESLVAKAKRPIVDKNFEQDVSVLRTIASSIGLPEYLIHEVERVVRDELSFVREASNQREFRASLAGRNAMIELNLRGEKAALPLVAMAPLSAGEVLYPPAESKEDLGLMVEQYVKGLSLKELREYQAAVRAGTAEASPLREKLARQYGESRLGAIESRIMRIDTDELQAQLGLEFLRQVMQGGIFHADLHSGNFYLDFTPETKAGELYSERGVFIDLGSVGYSDVERMPADRKQETEKQSRRLEVLREIFIGVLMNTRDGLAAAGAAMNEYFGVSLNVVDLEQAVATWAHPWPRFERIFGVLKESQGGVITEDQKVFIHTMSDVLRKRFLSVPGIVKTGPELLPENVQIIRTRRIGRRESFRNFVTALFGKEIAYDALAQEINQYTMLMTTGADIKELVKDHETVDGKVKKIFYYILEQAGGENIDPEFRYFLKALTTASGHLDKLKQKLEPEIDNLFAGKGDQNVFIPALAAEGLVDVNLIAEQYLPRL